MAKNAAWWIGAVPAFVFARDFKTFALILLSLVGWTFIYYLRAITEETHLLLGNNGYEAYRKKVRYRFIPGII